MTNLAQQIAADLTTAMKQRDALRKNVLRAAKSALDKQSKDSGGELDAAAAIAAIAREVKQREEAAQLYADAGDSGREASERSEAAVLREYLPKQLDSEEIVEHIDAAISEVGAKTLADLGKVMGRLSPALGGRADMKQVAADVRARLSA